MDCVCRVIRRDVIRPSILVCVFPFHGLQCVHVPLASPPFSYDPTWIFMLRKKTPFPFGWTFLLFSSWHDVETGCVIRSKKMGRIRGAEQEGNDFEFEKARPTERKAIRLLHVTIFCVCDPCGSLGSSMNAARSTNTLNTHGAGTQTNTAHYTSHYAEHSEGESGRCDFTRATLQKFCPCEIKTKTHENEQNERKRESFTHAWPHLCTADPSKDGDQNIPKVLAPKMKTEEQQQHKIKREAKKTRKKSRREKEREERENY